VELSQVGKSKGIEYNTSQIEKYAKLGGTPQLDMDYTVFGEIIDGYEVIDKIAAVQTGTADRPVNDVKMKIRLIN
jgi:cyclophilin family peptidyl-prolyl cis-trans isomerase